MRCICASVSALVTGLLATNAASGAEPSRAPESTNNAPLFAACFGDAAATSSYVRQGRYLLFTCRGAAAQVFYDRLGRRAPDVAYEETRPDGVYRFTERPKKDTTGLDYCRQAPSGAPPVETLCVLTFPAGTFLDR